MNAPDCTVDGCAGQCPDNAYLCPACTGELVRALVLINELAAELPAATVRLARVGEPGYSSAEKPLPFAAGAADMEFVLAHTLDAWVGHVETERGRLMPAPTGWLLAGPLCRLGTCRHESCITGWCSRGTVEARSAAWMATQIEWLRHRPEAESILGEIQYAARELRSVIDRKGPRWYAGRCGCETDMYGRAEADEVRCPGCGTRYDANTLRRSLLSLAALQETNAQQIGRALAAFDVTPNQVYGWIRYGKLPERGVDDRGRKLYRVGDAIRLAQQKPRRKRNDTPLAKTA